MTVYPNQNLDDQEGYFKEEEEFDLEKKKKKVTEEIEVIKKEISAKWQKRYAGTQLFPDKLKQVSPALLDFLLSFQNTFFYNQLSEKFNLNGEQRDVLPRIVWQICLNKNWFDFEKTLTSSLNIPQAKNISEEIEKMILSKAKELAEKPFSSQNNIVAKEPTENLVKTTLSDALKKFPEIGEQLITKNHIKLRNFPEPVRPSIKNWLSDYTYDSGYTSHNAVERGTFLFRNENSRELDSTDREKLAHILKSHDENTTITINTTTKQIVFPQKKFSPAPNKNTVPSNLPVPPTNFSPNSQQFPPRTNLNFSSPQKMSFENQTPTQLTVNKNPNQGYNVNNKSVPKNVVNLKEDLQ